MIELEKNHRLFLVKETAVSIVINAVLNFIITFLMFRSQDAIMLWGKDGLFFDLIPTNFFIIFCMTLFMTPGIRKRILKGTAPAAPWRRKEHAVLRFFPGVLVVRALAMAIFALITFLPVSTGLLASLIDFPILFKEMLLLKTCYGALIGFLFSPIIVLCAMADRGEVVAQQV